MLNALQGFIVYVCEGDTPTGDKFLLETALALDVVGIVGQCLGKPVKPLGADLSPAGVLSDFAFCDEI